MPPRQPQMLVHTLPGFEPIAALEAKEVAEAEVVRSLRLRDQNGLLLLRHDGDVEDLLGLRTVEDVFVVVAQWNELTPARSSLEVLERVAFKANMEHALRLFREANPRKSLSGKLPFRVISRQAGRPIYHRRDAQMAIERAFSNRTDHKWRIAEEAPLELWMTMFETEAILALRLSDASLRQREYKQAHLPASLRPSAAAGLAWLTNPQDDDVFLDPLCGAGTTLIERAHLGRYQLLLGGDERQEAVDAALTNIGPRFKPIEVQRWDARQLPLDEGAISAAAVNLPFGKQIGSLEENRELYPLVLRELSRVLRPKSRLVALSGDGRGLERAMQRQKDLRRTASYPVSILGRHALIMVAERR